MTEQTSVYAVLLQLEREARHAESEDAFRFVVVNQTRRLVAFRQAVLVRLEGPGLFVVDAVSNVPVIDREAPLVRWIARVLAALRPDLPPETPLEPGQPAGRRLDPAALPEALRADWAEWWLPEALWQPLTAPDGRLLGGLVLLREEPFKPAERVLADRLADAYAHAWEALRRRLGRRFADARTHRRRRWIMAAAAAVAVVVLAWPVRQSALAPAEVVPRDPWMVAAPLEGVVEEVLVQPNQPVALGDVLFRFEEAPLRARRDVAAKQLAVAEADLRLAQQGAFRDVTRKGEVALKEAAVALRQAELAYAEEMLARAVVTAPAAGVAVFADRDHWTGRPVAVGERVMVVADPARTELRAWLPVSDAIGLEPGTDVRLFLAVDPLAPVAAVLRRASYDAEMRPDGVLAYRIEAEFDGDTAAAAPRLGLQGTAKLYGERAPLAFTLFRRPIATVRQVLGL
ncbi:efflux RND transporter periplasmic adaptor subunit [Caenispirillum bisanense]|uniref:Biotin-lipoyl like n=1 Tax=Caenispirillum bisanense TaxID=414052 RepID=A0A286G6D2_9PROT|nr:HlyD family efflux transporter periplasmic adaptor subunit [Caenispirillum bisanense]SOD90766.1 Biotin-lipoyl like [Caenispirillum bisanense]